MTITTPMCFSPRVLPARARYSPLRAARADGTACEACAARGLRWRPTTVQEVLGTTDNAPVPIRYRTREQNARTACFYASVGADFRQGFSAPAAAGRRTDRLPASVAVLM